MPSLVLELYVQGQGRRSSKAIARVRDLADRFFGQAYRLDVIDIGENDRRVREAGIIVTPSLRRRWPEPVLLTAPPFTDERIRQGMGLND